MRYVILLLLLATALCLIFRHGGNRGETALGIRVRVTDLPSVLGRLRGSGRDGSFAGFIVPGDLAALATGVMTELYRRAPDDEVELVAEGFDWP